MSIKFVIEWVDGRRSSKVKSDPNFPNGVDIDKSIAGYPSCKVDLVYPAPRIGIYIIDCTECYFRSVCVTHGRADDPKSCTMPCILMD